MKAKDLLTAGQQEMLVAAIKEAEKNTSGEIRIHIDDRCTGDPVERAGKVFHFLGMDRTALRNGILIYLACESKVFAVIGDKGINRMVPEGFWNDISAVMSEEFRKGDFLTGLQKAVLMAGEKLKDFFPYREDDINEQPDEISFGGHDQTTTSHR